MTPDQKETEGRASIRCGTSLAPPWLLSGSEAVSSEIDLDHRAVRPLSDNIVSRRAGGRQMPSYRVCFINEIPRNEKLFHCCQRSIVIRSARTPERAVEAEKKRFARLEGIRNWKIHAALIEIEPIDIEPKPEHPAPVQERTRISAKNGTKRARVKIGH